MNLYRVVCVLVGVLGVHAFCQRSEGIGKPCVLLLLLTLFGCQFALACYVVESFVYVDVSCSLIQYAATGVELGLHTREHVVYGREPDDGCVELLAVFCVRESLVVCSLAHTYRLCGYAQTRSVHQSHDIFDETHACAAAQLSLRVLVYKLTCGRAMYSQLVLYVAYGHTALVLVVYEHGQSATVMSALLGACEHEMYVRVAVGDESFHSVEQPAAVFLAVCSLEHHALEVGTGVRFGKVHTHGLACAYPRNVFLALLLTAELIESLYAILQRPDVLEACVSS